MLTTEVIINNDTGLDSKLATKLIQRASSYKSSIWVEKGERKANAKSLLGILSLGVGKAEKLTVIIEGEDEQDALKDLEQFIGSRIV